MVVRYCADRQAGDTITISEKVALLLTGRTVAVDDIAVGWTARVLSKFIRPQFGGALGLAVPAKMQYVMNVVGKTRVFAAAGAAAFTRPFGVHGTFFRLAGPFARDVDGGVSPYETLLFPPFDSDEAAILCAQLEEATGVGVAIVDMNDFGGSIRAVSPKSRSAAELADVLADNPHRQKYTSTPFLIIRPC
ncbi:hypothetical protein [Actinopolymorpha alba]|uniref:hypothetical protein n=1 Tax=Actinopolymorpha alba TaxID=533267 RepID=UPI000364C232|nr:hypothetical protein [Actinopolymorpha alba]